MSAPTYQGQPCTKGHDGTRYVSTRGCVHCARDRDAGRPRPYVRKAERAEGRRTVRATPQELQARAAPMTIGQGEGAQVLGEALAHAMTAAGRAHVALTLLEGGLWQVVALRPGYKDQVTRTGHTAGEALARALGDSSGRADALLSIIG